MQLIVPNFTIASENPVLVPTSLNKDLESCKFDVEPWCLQVRTADQHKNRDGLGVTERPENSYKMKQVNKRQKMNNQGHRNKK